MKVPFFEPWITDADKKSIVKSLDSRWLTNGPKLEAFEKKISGFVNTKYAAGVGNATQALHLALRSIDIKPGDEVLVPTLTFVATANAVRYCGAKPILVDIEQDTFNISINDIIKKISKKTKAIIPVHYGGQACDMDDIIKIAKSKNLSIIEDCAHALGSTYKKKKCGSFGKAGCFSFYATKIITTAEGGMVTTSSQQIIKKIRLLRSQAMSIQAKDREKRAKWKYDIIDMGFNYRLDEIRAALGISQFQRISQFNKFREAISKKYDKEIAKIKGITIPERKHDRNHVFHLYTIKIEKDYHLTRDQLYLKLHKNGIGSSVQYFPLHLMSEFRKEQKNNFKNANVVKDKILCLPIFPKMTKKQIEFVISKLK